MYRTEVPTTVVRSEVNILWLLIIIIIIYNDLTMVAMVRGSVNLKNKTKQCLCIVGSSVSVRTDFGIARTRATAVDVRVCTRPLT